MKDMLVAGMPAAFEYLVGSAQEIYHAAAKRAFARCSPLAALTVMLACYAYGYGIAMTWAYAAGALTAAVALYGVGLVQWSRPLGIRLAKKYVEDLRRSG